MPVIPLSLPIFPVCLSFLENKQEEGSIFSLILYFLYIYIFFILRHIYQNPGRKLKPFPVTSWSNHKNLSICFLTRQCACDKIWEHFRDKFVTLTQLSCKLPEPPGYIYLLPQRKTVHTAFATIKKNEVAENNPTVLTFLFGQAES